MPYRPRWLRRVVEHIRTENAIEYICMLGLLGAAILLSFPSIAKDLLGIASRIASVLSTAKLGS